MRSSITTVRCPSHLGSNWKWVSSDSEILVYSFYIAIDPCVGVTCELFGVCADTGPRSYECVAPSCDSSIDEPVCASDGVSYDNECEYHRFVFNTRRSDIVIYHRGRCNGMNKHNQSFSLINILCFSIPFSTRKRAN